MLMNAACGDGSGDQGLNVVHFYNWVDYIGPRTLASFEAETGIEVQYDTYDSNEILEGKLLMGGAGYDVVVPSDIFFARQQQAGIYHRLDKSRLENFENLDAQLLAKLQHLDPRNEHGVPYSWGTVGLGVRVDAVRRRIPNAPLDSWELLFDPQYARRLADCGITLLDAPDDVANVTLNFLGISPASDNAGDLQRAYDLVNAIRPYIRYFDSSQYVDDLANGEVCLALGWSGGVHQAIAHGREKLNIRYVVPKEGTVLWMDVLAVPSDAPNPDEAHRLIDFLMRPEIAAAFTNSTYYATANRSALELIRPGIRNDPGIYPSEAVMGRLFFPAERSPEYVRKRTRLWTQIKTGM